MKINFKKIQIQQVDGTTQEVDIANAFSKAIYNSTPSLPIAVAMQEIYKNGEVDLNKEQVKEIRKTMEQIGATAYIKMALYPIFDKIEE